MLETIYLVLFRYFTNIPLGFGLLLLPFFEEFWHHHLGAVALFQRPQVFGLQGHFVAFNGHTKREKRQFNSIWYIKQFNTNKFKYCKQMKPCLKGFQPPSASLHFKSFQYFFLSPVCVFIHWLKSDSKTTSLLSQKQLNKNSFPQRHLMEFPGFANHHYVLVDQIPPEIGLIYFPAQGGIGLQKKIEARCYTSIRKRAMSSLLQESKITALLV